jgi:multidrug efflux pump subunit AcrB
MGLHKEHGPVWLHSTGSALSRRFDRCNEWARTGVERYLSWALEHRFCVMVSTVVFSFRSSRSLIPAESAPDIDQGRFLIRISMPRELLWKALAHSPVRSRTG